MDAQGNLVPSRPEPRRRAHPTTVDTWTIQDGRRLCYRLGVDHDNGNKSVFWWTTPQTEYWIERFLHGDRPETPAADWRRPGWGDRRPFNTYVGKLYRKLHGGQMSFDASANSADDWGCVDLERDPIQVLAVGPYSGGQTRADVEMTLRRAGSQLAVSYAHAEIELGCDPGEPQADALWALAQQDALPCDVVVLYRGGFDRRKPLSTAPLERILDAANILVSRGVEVVIGLGHGTTDVHEATARRPAIGVHEAVTPTAAANWVLTEHVNQRLMNAVPDCGQTRG